MVWKHKEAFPGNIAVTISEEESMADKRELDKLVRQFDTLQDLVARGKETVVGGETPDGREPVAQLLDRLQALVSEMEETMEGVKRRFSAGINRGRLSSRVIRAQEDERQRVARDIHDGPAQALANVVFRVDICEKLLEQDVERAKTELERLKRLVRQSLQDVRKIIFDLRPMALDDLGLTSALRGYFDDFEDKTDVSVTFSVHGGDKEIDSAVETTVFRIIQEALNNAWKHAQSENVSVELWVESDAVKAAVEDDGRGFDLEQVMDSRGLDCWECRSGRICLPGT